MDQAKFKLDSQGIEVSGSEAFVVAQLERFDDLIRSSYQKILSNSIQTNPHVGDSFIRHKVISEGNSMRNSMSEDAEYIELPEGGSVKFDNVFIYDGGRIQVISDIPGNTTSSKMINLVLIVLWAKMKQGIESVQFSELREVCMNYGHFDSSNFARYMDQNKKFFLLSGDGKNKSAKLIRPGIKEAERLITELNNKS